MKKLVMIVVAVGLVCWSIGQFDNGIGGVVGERNDKVVELLDKI